MSGWGFDVIEDGPPWLDWNVVLTTREAAQGRVRRSLRRMAKVRRSNYRNVLLAQAENVEEFLDRVCERVEQQRNLREGLGKLLPVSRVFAIEDERLPEQLGEQAAEYLEHIAGRTFHVRVERRGHKGRINSLDTERDLGARILAALEAEGRTARVSFADPDLVVAVEIVGRACGVGLVTRAMRERWPLVRID